MKVFLDSGHGGKDTGAVGNGIKEKDRALDYCLDIGQELKRHGVEVVYSRTSDIFLELNERAVKANKTDSNVFVSIHLNSFSNPSSKGFEVYHYTNSSNGKQLASNIHSEIVKEKLYTLDRGVKSANFAVLRLTKMQSCLIELGFISNKEDVQLLADKQSEVVKGIVKGILNTINVKYKDKDIKPSSGDVTSSQTVKIRKGDKVIEVEGYLQGDSNYVKVREVFEKLGYKVSWEDDTVVVR